MSTDYDITIFGSGPAGLTAAIYTSRASLNTLVIAGSSPGGQLMTTTDVENFPGYSNGIQGPQLMSEMLNQAKKFGTFVLSEDVVSLSGDAESGFSIITGAGTKIMSKTVIIATGASAKWLGLESEQKLRGKGVSACATCDGYFFQNKIVAVVGGGDTAMEEAEFLTRFSKKVYVLVRKDQDSMKASKIMQKKVSANKKVEFMFNTEIVEVLGDDKVTGLKIKNNLEGQESVLTDVEGLFLAIGHQPNTAFLAGFVDVHETGYVKVTDVTKTSKPGVFVAGDVADYRYRQAITAAGTGCMAALDVEKFLSSRNPTDTVKDESKNK